MCKVFIVTIGLFCCAMQCHGLNNCLEPFTQVLKKCYYIDTEIQEGSFEPICMNINRKSDRVTFDRESELRAIARFLQRQGLPDGSKFWTSGDRLNDEEIYIWDSILYPSTREINDPNWLTDEGNYADHNFCLQLVYKDQQLFSVAANCEDRAYHLCELTLTKQYKIDQEFNI